MRAGPIALVCIVAAAAAALFAARCSDEDRPGRSDTEVPALATGDGTLPSADRAAVEGDLRTDRRRRIQRGVEPSSPAADTDDPPPPVPDDATTGTVRDAAGRPVAGALVAGRNLDHGAEAMTDESGGFVIGRPLDREPVWAFAVVNGVQHYGRSRDGAGRLGVEVTVVPVPPTDRFHILRITGHDGGAVASAQLQFLRGERRNSGWIGFQFTARGGIAAIRCCECDPPPEKVVLVVSEAADADGRVLPYAPALVELDPWSSDESTVHLPPGNAVVGRAEGPRGAPLADVWIRIAAPPPAGYDGDHMAPVAARWIRTADDGSFRVEGLAAGTATLRVEPDAPQHGGAGATAVVGVETPVVVRCDALVPIRLRVVGEQGQPLGRISVEGIRDAPASRTAADGTVTVLPLPSHDAASPPQSGSSSLLVNGLPGFERVRLALAPGTTEQTVRLRRVVPIRGVVLGPDGRPAPGVPVAINRSAAQHAEWSSIGFTVREALVAESATLSIRGPGDTWIDTTVPADAPRAEDVVLRIPDPGRALSIYVARAERELPVSIRHAGTEIGRIDKAGALSHFDIGDGADRVDVQVGPDSSGRFAFIRDVAPRGFLRVDLVNGASVSGRVTTAEGHHVPYADVVVTTPDGFRATATAERDGRVTLWGVPAGRVTVSATWRNRRGQVEIDAPSDKLAIVID